MMHGLEAQAISKTYGSLRALDDVSCAFAPGEIHAVLGENGAGKSTLMGVLSGFVTPDSGQVSLDDAPLPSGRPLACRRRGVQMVHQHFTLAPRLTVAENLALSELGNLAAPLSVEGLAAKALDLGRELGWELDSHALVQDLPVGVQQRIEILKCLAAKGSVLILDEPTAVLSQAEVDDLFRVLRELALNGRTVILIAHKLPEVMAIADRVTVLRRGKLVATSSIHGVKARTLAEWMVGDLPPEQVKTESSPGEIFLTVHNLDVKGDRGEKAVNDVTFQIRQGEILGFGGVDGNGQVELAEALAGVRRCSGELTRSGDRIGYIPQDRQHDGLALGMSIEENMLVAGLSDSRLTHGPFLRIGAITDWAEELIQTFDIRAGSARQSAGSLSGGNQQKIVVSRELQSDPELLVAVNPTRGLDINATRFVHEKILEARARGAAVALFSTDLDELNELADRKLFMSRGRLIEGFDAATVVGGLE